MEFPFLHRVINRQDTFKIGAHAMKTIKQGTFFKYLTMKRIPSAGTAKKVGKSGRANF